MSARNGWRIGEGYGSGSVIMWDIGAYANLTKRDGARVDAVRRSETAISVCGWRGNGFTGGTP